MSRSPKSSQAQRYEHAIRVVERQGIRDRIAMLCGRWSLDIVLQVGMTPIPLVAAKEPLPGDAEHLIVPLPHHDPTLMKLVCRGHGEHLPMVATLAAQWLGDVLQLEHEMTNLAQEIVHSYEELDLLYSLGGALGGMLNVASACTLIVDAVLDPLNAVYATITLKHENERPVTHRSTNREYTDGANLAACATAELVVGGELIGVLAVYGKRSGGEFSSGDYKLLDGVASVSAPVLHNAQLYEAACQQAQTDSLTGVYNHRRIQEHLEHNLEWARQYGTSTSIIMVEIDHLDLFNELYGVPVGNAVQRLIADSLRAALRPGDAVGSYGEDKFLVVLPNTDARTTLVLARHVLTTIRTREIVVEGSRLAVRASLGTATFPEHGAGKQALIAAAMTALREASAGGGATVRTAGYTEQEQTVDSEGFSILHGLVQAVDAKDHYTQEHSEVVTHAALLIAERLGLPDEACDALRVAGALHDIGKIGIPDSILKKPGKLTAEEYEIMKQHVVLSDLIVRGVPQLPGVQDAVQYHHERYDGTGYPSNRHGEETPLLGRIMAVADAYSAMCIDRPYRKGLSWHDIRSELMRGSGTQFDPRIVEVFIEAMEELRARGQELGAAHGRVGVMTGTAPLSDVPSQE